MTTAEAPTFTLSALPNPKVSESIADRHVHKVGTPAFYDTFAGMVECKVTEIKPGRHYGHSFGNNDTITAIITESRGAYHKGETIVSGPAHIIPTKFRVLRGYQYRINCNYCYEAPTPIV